MPVTVQDVAASAGVSPATVSRILNKRQDIAPHTRQVVEQAILRLGYKRSVTRRGRTVVDNALVAPSIRKPLALLIPDIHIEAMLTPLTGQVMHGAEAVARRKGYRFLLTRLAEKDGLPPVLAAEHLDGIIVRSGEDAPIGFLPDVPTVWVFQSLFSPASGDMVFPDNAAIGEMACRYLTDRGHRHLAIINAQAHPLDVRQRAESFAHAAGEAGIQTLAIDGDCTGIEGAVARALACVPSPTGFFLTTGDDALEDFLRALPALKTPDGSGLDMISCSNDAARLGALSPHLSNIDIQADEIGRMAAETLLWRIENPAEHRRCVLIRPRLVAGRS